MKDYLAFIGIITIIGLAIFSLILIWEGVGELINKAVWKYKYTHRFDKKPIAKCYCKDCVWYRGNGYCQYSEGCGDACFCWRAEPRKNDI